MGQKIDGIHCIRNDDYYAARILAEYLLRLGHRKFLYFGVKKYDEAVGVYRQKGLFDILQREGVEIEYQECEFLADYSKNEAMKILPDTNATCVVCATDNIALGVHRACYELGINIPEDLSICGFGGYEWGRCFLHLLQQYRSPLIKLVPVQQKVLLISWLIKRYQQIKFLKDV